MTLADVPAAQRLREQAGWNQTDQDWQRLLAWEPTGCWVAELDSRVVASTTVTTYDTRIAWIGMVLVDEAHRRRGIGTRMLAHAQQHLDAEGVRTVALDATPAGRSLYETHGYRERYGLERRRGTLNPPSEVTRAATGIRPADVATATPEAASRATPTAGHVRPLLPADLAAVAAYDAQIFGTARDRILGALAEGHPADCVVAERADAVTGYALCRPGARAVHLGPLVADDGPTAELLACAALRDHRGREAIVDVVTSNQHAVSLAGRLGLTPVRPFIRMTRGAEPPSPDLRRLYTSAGPEIG